MAKRKGKVAAWGKKETQKMRNPKCERLVQIAMRDVLGRNETHKSLARSCHCLPNPVAWTWLGAEASSDDTVQCAVRYTETCSRFASVAVVRVASAARRAAWSCLLRKG